MTTLSYTQRGNYDRYKINVIIGKHELIVIYNPKLFLHGNPS